MNELIAPQKLADLLCLSEATLRKWRWEGKGPRFVKVGRKVAYRSNDIQSFIEQQIRNSTSDNGINTSQ